MKNQFQHFSIWVVNYVKRPTVIFFGIIIFILSSVVTIADGYRILRNITNKSVRHNQVMYEKLNHLTTETHIKYFQSVLGEPVYINNYHNAKLKEFIFVDEAYFVQAVTDGFDQVLMYSVTVRKSEFYPKVPMHDLWLGRSTFADVRKVFNWEYKNDGGPEWLISWIGAHDYFYSEGYYLANPGGYQTLFLSMSLAGFLPEENLDITDMPGYYTSPNIEYIFSKEMEYEGVKYSEEIQKFLMKNKNTINTYTIIAPFLTTADIKGIRTDATFYLMGPNHNQVRLLDYR